MSARTESTLTFSRIFLIAKSLATGSFQIAPKLQGLPDGWTPTPDQIESIAKTLCGMPNLSLSSLRNLRFGTHGSLKVDLKTGLWFDFETNEGGDMFALVKRQIGCDDRGAFEWLGTRGYKAPSAPGLNGERGRLADYNEALGTAQSHQWRSYRPKR